MKGLPLLVCLLNTFFLLLQLSPLKLTAYLNPLFKGFSTPVSQAVAPMCFDLSDTFPGMVHVSRRVPSWRQIDFEGALQGPRLHM